MKPVLSWGACASLAILAAAVPAIAADGFRWETNLASAQSAARQSGRLVLIHFGGPWCPPCQMLERNVFSQPGFGRELTADYVGVKVDPNSSPEANAIAVKYGIQRVPTDVVTTPGGQLVVRLQSPSTAEAYVRTLAAVAGQVQPERRTTPSPATTPANPPQVAGQGASGNRLAQRPADERYADYYNRQPSVQREPYQPPVRNQPSQAAPQSPVQGGSAPADRYADRSADQYPTRSAAPSPPAAEDRYAPQDRYAAEDRYSPSQDRYSQQPASSSLADRAAAETQIAARSQVQPEKSSGEPPAEEPLVREELVDETRELEAKLPPGSPPLALDGYCVVSLFEDREKSQRSGATWGWQRGDVKWGAIHRGQLYLFVNQEAQQKFLAHPDHYCPVCKGHDPVLVLDQNQAVPGQRQFGVFYGDRIFLFANESTLEQFSQNPKRYSAEILQAMRQ